MTKLKPIKDTTLDCMNDLIGDLEHYEQWFNNEEYCKEELKCLKGWSERVKKDLTELQAIKEAKPSEALEIFKEFKNILLENIVLLDTDLQRLNTIEQALLKSEKLEKAWEVVVDKMVSIRLLNACDWVEDYNQETHNLRGLAYGLPELTEEEFELIKGMIE